MKYMNYKKGVSKLRVMLITLGVLLLLPSMGNAAHYAVQCATELNSLEMAIEDANFIGRRSATNRSNLLAKLEAANAKISLYKYSDAIDKLEAISDNATNLADAQKQKLADATAINVAVSNSISCTATLQ